MPLKRRLAVFLVSAVMLLSVLCIGVSAEEQEKIIDIIHGAREN